MVLWGPSHHETASAVSGSNQILPVVPYTNVQILLLTCPLGNWTAAQLLGSKQAVRSFRQEEEWKSWAFWMVRVFQSQRSLGGCMRLPKNCCKSTFHRYQRHWQVWNAPRSTLRLLHLLILAVSLGRKRQHLGFEGNRVGAAGCILKMVPCSIFTSSLFPARVHRKQVYSHLSFAAVFSEATWRNMILLLQLLNISPGNLSFMVSLRGGWSCFSFLSVSEKQHLQREGRAFSGKG